MPESDGNNNLKALCEECEGICELVTEGISDACCLCGDQTELCEPCFDRWNRRNKKNVAEQ